MKLLGIVVIPICLIGIWANFESDNITQNLREQNAKLRRERNMYDSLYRTANTRLMHFQDSINCHCICK